MLRSRAAGSGFDRVCGALLETAFGSMLAASFAEAAPLDDDFDSVTGFAQASASRAVLDSGVFPAYCCTLDTTTVLASPAISGAGVTDWIVKTLRTVPP